MTTGGEPVGFPPLFCFRRDPFPNTAAAAAAAAAAVFYFYFFIFFSLVRFCFCTRRSWSLASRRARSSPRRWPSSRPPHKPCLRFNHRVLKKRRAKKTGWKEGGREGGCWGVPTPQPLSPSRCSGGCRRRRSYSISPIGFAVRRGLSSM